MRARVMKQPLEVGGWDEAAAGGGGGGGNAAGVNEHDGFGEGELFNKLANH